ncbi:MAG: thioredoxin family protein [Thermofilum sp.]|jgi:thioredoxin 1|nr:thioredoxin family protein [Thermofilum sp.]
MLTTCNKLLDVSKDTLMELLETKKVVVIDFYADWCVPCKVIDDILRQVSKLFAKYDSVCFVRVNIDVEREVAEKFEVLGLPTVIIVRNGVEVKRYSGVPRDLASDLAYTVKNSLVE